MTQQEANAKFTMGVNKTIEQIEKVKPVFDDYKKGENEDVTTSNAEDAALLLDFLIEELTGRRDDFQSIVDEDIEDVEDEDIEEEDESVDDSNAIGTGGYEKYEDQAENQKAESAND